MRTLFFDCGMGAAGDMLTAALLDTLEDKDSFIKAFNALGLPGVKMALAEAETCGIRGSRVHIYVHGQEEDCAKSSSSLRVPVRARSHAHDRDQHVHHPHTENRGLDAVMVLINRLPLSEAVRDNAVRVYRSIAEAEAKVHNRPLSEVHFHELGSLDAVADVVAFCMLIEQLAPDIISATAVHVGSGHIRCAHGVLPVPAPATAELLRGIPNYGGEIQGELCTPTGAALLRHFVTKFGPQPVMATARIGYGVGSKVFPMANCVRAFVGESDGLSLDSVEELRCNLDDMTGEAIGFAMELLLESGALDVYTVPIGMKKSRPAVMLCCLCASADTQRLSALMLRHTTSLGVRISGCRRITLPRTVGSVDTPYGPIRTKTAAGVTKPEYDDLARIAREKDITLGEAAELIKN